MKKFFALSLALLLMLGLAACGGEEKPNDTVKPVEMAMSIFEAFPDFIKKFMVADPEKDTVIYQYTTAFPVANALAQTWNTELMEEVGTAIYREMKEYGCTYWLAPAINIHRNPLCGRNFEYFSEDPRLTGVMAAALTRGVQQEDGFYVTVKHFACNNQEDNRNKVSSNLTERTLREIYLRGFEICVKTAHPNTIMTSYNKINGVWGHYNYELCERILREEWGFDGVVMTDWWMRSGRSPEFPEMKDNAYRVRAGVDVLMPGGNMFRFFSEKPDGTLLATYGKSDGITLGELQRTAKNVLRCVMELKL